MKLFRNKFIWLNKSLSAPLLTGIMLVLAMPPLKFGFLAWFALVPFFLALEKATTSKQAFNSGLIMGLVFHSGSVYWIALNTGADIGARLASGLGTIIILSLWFGLISIFHRYFISVSGKAGHFPAIILWTAQEIVRSNGELGFPWPYFVLTQGYYLPVLQLAAIGGIAMVSAWLIALNSIIAAGYNKRRTFTIIFGILAITWGAGYIREKLIYTDGIHNPIANIALSQGNIDPAEKWKKQASYSFDIYESLSKSVIEESPDLIVWPETAAPVKLLRNSYWRHYMQRFVDSLQVPVVTGASHIRTENNQRSRYNAAFLIKPGSERKYEKYFKVHLVPFGERVPLQKWIPSLGKLNFGQAEFKPGDSVTTWEIPINDKIIKFTPLICYEAIFSNLGLDASKLDTDVFLNLTNDGWLRFTSEPHQHLLLTRLRSIETGRSLVRATNTGISAVIGPSGRIVKSLPENVRGAIVTQVPAKCSTVFVSYGHYFNIIIILLIIPVLLFYIYRYKSLKKNVNNTEV